MERITLDTNVIGAALNLGKDFRREVRKGRYQVFTAEATLTLDGLRKQDKIALLAHQDVKHVFKKSKWDEYVNLGLSFLLCPRIGLPRPTCKSNAGELVEYTLLHKSNEHTYSQEQRQNRYFTILRYIQDELGAGLAWLVNLQDKIQDAGGTYKTDVPWFLNLPNNIIYIGESKLLKRFGDWTDADAIATHYAYGNDIFCTNDTAKGAGAGSVMSKNNREKIEDKYGVVFKSLNELL